MIWIKFCCRRNILYSRIKQLRLKIGGLITQNEFVSHVNQNPVDDTQNAPSVDYNNCLQRLDTQLHEPTNQNQY